MQPLKEYVRKAKVLGISQARSIKTETVVVGNWVRLKCQYGCGGHGACLTCPPYSPSPEYMKQTLSEYSRGLLLQLRDEDTGRKPAGAASRLRKVALDLERDLFLDGYYKAFAMPSGPCEGCRQCDPSGNCRHPDRARPSMEACGIDVYRTARNNGFALEVVTSADALCSFMALILID